ncbi:MAG: TonB-dependent receptor [Vicinamibacterales bacterium]
MNRLSGILAAALLLLSPWAGYGQSSTSSTVYGVIKDGTGAALPGVTVTLTSPQLQVPAVDTISGTDGTYRVTELPPGVYSIAYQLEGFTKSVRSEVQLTTGFIARIDITLSIGGLEETVTVSGQSPIVDVSSTSTGATLTRDYVEAIPRAKEFSALLTMTPGVVANGAPDVGGSSLTGRYQVDAFGVQAQPKLSVEGINTTTGSGNNSAVVFSSYNFDEVKVSTSGADAETSTPGISIVAVLKSGSNTFKGSFETSLQRPELQAENIDDAIRAQGVTAASALKYFYGVSADLGGRIVRDKLWFYGGWNRQTRVENQFGFVEGPGADGVYLTGDEPAGLVHTTLAGDTEKLSYQMSKKVKLIGVYQRGTKVLPEFNAGRFVPRESMDDYLDPTWVWKGEMQGTLSNRVLVNVNTGWGGYVADHNGIRGAKKFFGEDKLTSLVSRQYLETGLITGPSVSVDYRPRSRYQLDSSVTYFPLREVLGHHELKAGESIYWENTYTRDPSLPWGNFRLNYDVLNGVKNQPYSITMYNYPVDPRNRMNTYAGFVKDTWRITPSFTANLGLRYELQNAFLPAQAYPGSKEWPTVFPAASFSKVDVLTWKKLMPRIGIAYQVFPRSVLKSTWGVYANTAGDDFAETYNGNAGASAEFRWRDLDGNNTYTPGEVNLNPNGADFISITAGGNNIINRELKQPTTTEFTTAWEQELAKSMAIRFQYVYKDVKDSIGTINALRPYDVYTNAITRVDPGPDGILGTGDEGSSVTLYDYPTAYRGAAFVGNMRSNAPAPNTYNTIEMGATKRMSNRWSANFSYFATKNHQLITAVPANPNQNVNNIDNTWVWGTSLSGVIQMPKKFMLAAFLQAKSGTRGERTYVFRSIPNLSTITLRLGERGTLNNPDFVTLNLKASRKIRFGKTNDIDLTFDAFNVFNANTATNITKASGPTYGYLTGVLAPRVAQVGVKYSF